MCDQRGLQQLAQALLRNADVRQAVELLGKYRPKAGQDDIREFTWHYLWRLCRKCPIPSSEEDRDIAGPGVGNGQVEVTVAEVAREDARGPATATASRT
jgi:hypothetical protein